MSGLYKCSLLHEGGIVTCEGFKIGGIGPCESDCPAFSLLALSRVGHRFVTPV